MFVLDQKSGAEALENRKLPEICPKCHSMNMEVCDCEADAWEDRQEMKMQDMLIEAEAKLDSHSNGCPITGCDGTCRK